jgi:Xaa-Pro aminopeptidase
MFSKEIYTERRNRLKQIIGSGIILFLGNEQSSMNYKDNWYHFRQDSSFLYYCGLDIANLAMVIDIDNDAEVLFGNDATIDEIVWLGPMPAMSELAASSGISVTRKLSELEGYLKTAGATIQYLPPYRPEHYDTLSSLLQLQPAAIDAGVSISLIKAIVSMRSIKAPEEIIEIDKAVNITNQMHLAAMKTARAGETEAAIAGRLQSIAIAGGGDLSFPTILTQKGETLHIHYTNAVVKPGNMLLCDCGAQNDKYYAGDLTRTFPVNKAFTQLQRDVYSIVLNAQQAAADALKPGVRYLDVHLLACEKLVDGLKDIGLMKGDSKEAVANHAHTLFFQCGLGHMMGLDIHDMENFGEQYVGYTESLQKSKVFGLKSLRLGRELEPGFVLTVEPGLYFIPALMDIWKADKRNAAFINYDKLDTFRSFGGIRIEEDFLITNDGARLLGDPIAKSVQDVEACRLAAMDH